MKNSSPFRNPVNHSLVPSSKCIELTKEATDSGSDNGNLPRLSWNVSEMLCNIFAGVKEVNDTMQ